jgi:hypothetical protein
MKSSKKPDNVAWDEENEEYIAKLLPLLYLFWLRRINILAN